LLATTLPTDNSQWQQIINAEAGDPNLTDFGSENYFHPLFRFLNRETFGPRLSE
jgi:hypothetical protein